MKVCSFNAPMNEKQFNEHKKRKGVYCILYDNSSYNKDRKKKYFCLYVGQTANLHQRLKVHFEDGLCYPYSVLTRFIYHLYKDRLKIFFYKIESKKERLKKELSLIDKLRPPFNRENSIKEKTLKEIISKG